MATSGLHADQGEDQVVAPTISGEEGGGVEGGEGVGTPGHSDRQGLHGLADHSLCLLNSIIYQVILHVYLVDLQSQPDDGLSSTDTCADH